MSFSMPCKNDKSNDIWLHVEKTNSSYIFRLYDCALPQDKSCFYAHGLLHNEVIELCALGTEYKEFDFEVHLNEFNLCITIKWNSLIQHTFKFDAQVFESQIHRIEVGG